MSSNNNNNNNNNNNVNEVPIGNGVKFDTDKPRFDLVPPHAHLQVAKVFTMGAKKYGDRNWENGMKWSRILASLERHLNAIKRGEDIDPESGLRHIDHITANSMMLSEYYMIFPSGDDRSVSVLKNDKEQQQPPPTSSQKKNDHQHPVPALPTKIIHMMAENPEDYGYILRRSDTLSPGYTIERINAYDNDDNE